jgi:OOP family OmpA-OmpF porin
MNLKLLFPFLLTSFVAHAQPGRPPKQNTVKAQVNVMVTDGKQKPRKGEEVLFISETSGRQLSGRTNAAGKFSFALAAGDTYTIKLKTLNDTTNYSRIEIPALEPGQYFDAPFTVDIAFEPARTYTLDNVHFDTGKPTLRPDSFRELDEIAEYMKLKPEQAFEIGGHTDNIGREEDNQKLSAGRANSVKAYLVRKGVSATRLTAKGYGATRPVADNSTEEGRRKNRRTEITLL